VTALRLGILVAIALLLAGPARAVLLRVRWMRLAPRAAIVIWQALTAAIAIALVGGAIEAVGLARAGPDPRRAVTDFDASSLAHAPNRALSPGQLFALTALLIVGTVVLGTVGSRLVGHSHRRARRRLLVDLIADHQPEAPGALVLPCAEPAAFSLPGLRSRIVVSTGAIDALQRDELAAVLAHERAHVHARHDLVLLPFRAATTTIPRSRALARMRDEVATLVEIAADDRARRETEPEALARALCRLAVAHPPAELAASAPAPTSERVARALAARRRAPAVAFASILGAGALIALPIAALVVPLAR
jgi:Zn-dependent protease with chaperone function